jgi:hypothetical protein
MVMRRFMDRLQSLLSMTLMQINLMSAVRAHPRKQAEQHYGPLKDSISL